MKFNKFLYGAMALCMFASCSDNDSVTTGGDNNKEVTGGISYLGISLELPSEPSTRGANDFFEDGTYEEYSVKNAALLLFRGTQESSATFIGAYELGTEEAFDQPDKDNVTVSFQKAIKLQNKPEFNSSENLYGLAIVNFDDAIYTVNQDASLIVKTTEGDKQLASADNIAFSDFRKYITTNDFMDNGFFMTNAPLCNQPGMSNNPTGDDAFIRTLALLNKNAFQKTEVAAVQNPAGCVFVERAVAKITCSKFPATVEIPYTKVTLTENGVPEYTTEVCTLKVTDVKWAVDNEEATSYITRYAASTDDFTFWGYNSRNIYRFIGAAGMNDNTYDANEDYHKPNTPANGTTPEVIAPTWYRTYWCIDPAYSDDKAYNNQAANENAFAVLTKSGNDYASANALYPHENTFNLRHQNYKNTTRVVFKVKYASNTEGENIQLYAIRNQLQTFYLQSDVQNLFKRTVLGSTKLHDLILKYMKEGVEKVNYKPENFTFTFGRASETANGIEAGDYILTNIVFTDAFATANIRPLSQADQTDIENTLKEIVAAANNVNHVVEFTDNTCYYATYLHHFGDTYCKLPDNFTGTTVDEVYKNQNGTGLDNNRYLGRYGLVRNNWYDLSVDLISKLGKATVPDGNVETSDDNNVDEWYLSARVHILSWAKRTQSVKFD